MGQSPLPVVLDVDPVCSLGVKLQARKSWVSSNSTSGCRPRVPSYITSCFSLAALKIPSLSLAFGNLIIIYLGVDLFGCVLFAVL